MICLDPRNPQAASLLEALSRELDLDRLPEELCLVIGGDGWMLRCVREQGPDRVYLGLNAGHLGFLLNDVQGADGLTRAARAIEEGRYRPYPFPRLRMEATTVDGERREALAVNDVYVERSSGHTARLSLRIDGVTIVEQMACDGLIVATGLGSTAYSFSAGGVPCHPLVRALQVTPICPHNPRLSPFSLPESTSIEIAVLDHALRPARVVADGVEHGTIRELRVARAEPDIRLAFLEGQELTATLVRKILRA